MDYKTQIVAENLTRQGLSAEMANFLAMVKTNSPELQYMLEMLREQNQAIEEEIRTWGYDIPEAEQKHDEQGDTAEEDVAAEPVESSMSNNELPEKLDT